MTDARTEILERLRTALADRPVPAPVQRTYEGAVDTPVEDAVVDEFAERVSEYRATVTVCSADNVTEVVTELLAARGSASTVAPAGLEPAWAKDADRSEPDQHTLDRVDSVVTAAELAIARTGTIVLDHAAADQGPRRLSLVPDHHVVIVRRDQIVRGVPDALARLRPDHPQTWISGPSATSDIELDRVEGVHGPRRLDVVLVH